jgi:hypothetical protein
MVNPVISANAQAVSAQTATARPVRVKPADVAVSTDVAAARPVETRRDAAASEARRIDAARADERRRPELDFKPERIVVTTGRATTSPIDLTPEVRREGPQTGVSFVEQVRQAFNTIAGDDGKVTLDEINNYFQRQFNANSTDANKDSTSKAFAQQSLLSQQSFATAVFDKFNVDGALDASGIAQFVEQFSQYARGVDTTA